jgi:hypothetical protein
MNLKLPIIIKKIEAIDKPSPILNYRESKKLQTEQHVIRDYYCNRKTYY